MNNCRSGLYCFASTAAWLHERGVASPPLLVTLGLTLPDSRILNGIAAIGLTLINIVIILPHLRQPIFDAIHSRDRELNQGQRTRERADVKTGLLQPVDLAEESLIPVSTSSFGEHQRPSIACDATIKSVHSVVTEPSECRDAHSEVTLHKVEETDIHRIPSRICHSPSAHHSENHIDPLAREYLSPFFSSLPVSDAEEVVFFSTTDVDSNCDLKEECSTITRDQHTDHDKHRTAEVNGPADGEVIERACQFVDIPSTSWGMYDDFTDVEMFTPGEGVVSSPIKPTVRSYHNYDGQFVDFVATKAFQDAQIGQRDGDELLAERRPESLEFVPQSVIRRYPLASTGPARHCFGKQTFISGHSHKIPPEPPYLLRYDPAMLLGGVRPRANYTTLEAFWRTSFSSEEYLKGLSTGTQAATVETISTLAPLRQLSEPPVREVPPKRKYPAHRHRLGVLARAFLRDRRTVRRCRNDEDDSSSASESDSNWDSGSQYSSGSSADENMLPHMLGADLIAAIDANSESGLNLVGAKRNVHGPLDVYEDFLSSDDSAAGTSMITQISSIDNASDSGAGANATSRSLTYDDIQQWACGVVQKCVRQVYRNRLFVEPLSPSQVSDVCAERPSSSGASQCPLAGLHCKLGAPALSRTKSPQTSLPPATTSLPNRKLLSVRNVDDIPEFVPRQRQTPVVAVRGESPQKHGTRSTVNAAHDAASVVIARMESQARFNTRYHFTGMDENQTPVGRQRTQRCA